MIELGALGARPNFPLDVAIKGKEVLYPGMHSDVGGGYTPGCQGKALPTWGPSPHLSQIPLIDMHYEAIKAGVPLLSIGENKADNLLARAFSCDGKLITAYNAWLLAHGVAAGAHDRQIRAHTRQYLRWRGLFANQMAALRREKQPCRSIRLKPVFGSTKEC